MYRPRLNGCSSHSQIYHDALGKNGALGFMIVLCVIEFLIGLSLVCDPLDPRNRV